MLKVFLILYWYLGIFAGHMPYFSCKQVNCIYRIGLHMSNRPRVLYSTYKSHKIEAVIRWQCGQRRVQGWSNVCRGLIFRASSYNPALVLYYSM